MQRVVHLIGNDSSVTKLKIKEIWHSMAQEYFILIIISVSDIQDYIVLSCLDFNKEYNVNNWPVV